MCCAFFKTMTEQKESMPTVQVQVKCQNTLADRQQHSRSIFRGEKRQSSILMRQMDA